MRLRRNPHRNPMVRQPSGPHRRCLYSRCDVLCRLFEFLQCGPDEYPCAADLRWDIGYTFGTAYFFSQREIKFKMIVNTTDTTIEVVIGK